MGWRDFKGRADVDSRNPKPFATCDRCGILYNKDNLSWQMQVSGASVVNTMLLVCRICKDDLAKFLTPSILPQDPKPIFNARPEPYTIDEVDFRVTEDLDQRITENIDSRIVDNSQDE